MISIGQIFSHWFQPVETPEPMELELIDGGPNAPHLAHRPRDYSPELIESGEWEAQVKLDGIRCLYIDGRLVTLEGQPMNCARHCLPAIQELEKLFGCGPLFFDGEYVEEEGFEATQRAYGKGEGQGVFWIFDAMPIEEWRTGEPGKATWKQRQAQLTMNYQAAPSPWVGVLGSWRVADDRAAQTLFNKMRAHYYEGIVLKRTDARYTRQRNGDWLRLKPYECTDMKLVDIEGTPEKGAQRLVCRDPLNTSPVILTAGFASERLVIWENRDLFLGDENTPGILVEVAHCGRTLKGKPRHARFSKLRQDKLPPMNPGAVA